MDKPAFFKLAHSLTVQRAASGLAFSKSSPLLRLSITLRWLAGGSYLDISLAHGVAPSSLYHHIDHTLSDIDRSLKIKFPYNDNGWLQETSKGFTREGRSPLHGCCAALDGVAIKKVEPSREEVGNTSTYYNRKVFFAINLQWECDHKYRFVFASGLAAGSTHGFTAFAMSSLASLLSKRDNGLPIGYWIACDEAYAAPYNMLTPWPGRNLPREKDCFNYWLSSARIHIEQAFGLLVRRWGILWRPLRLKVSKAAKLIIILCKLHNFVIDEMNSCEVPPPSGIDTTYHSSDPDFSVLPQDLCDTDENLHRRRRDLERSDLRDRFTSEIKDEGLRRPSLY